MKNISKPELARNILVELLAILDSQGETNWRRGIKSAIAEITSNIDTDSAIGFDNARSIYNTMTAGGRGFSEYFIWLDNEDERIKKNNTLDNLRSRIWTIFNA